MVVHQLLKELGPEALETTFKNTAGRHQSVCLNLIQSHSLTDVCLLDSVGRQS